MVRNPELSAIIAGRFGETVDESYLRMADILRDIEREWTHELGSAEFAQLNALLVRVWESPLFW